MFHLIYDEISRICICRRKEGYSLFISVCMHEKGIVKSCYYTSMEFPRYRIMLSDMANSLLVVDVGPILIKTVRL